MFKLEDIKDPSFVKNLSRKELDVLASEIRDFLIENISKTGGHLASNLGVVELSIALHYVFNSPDDKFIYDVGHQTYTHKILTGRAADFKSLRKIDGLSGYANRSESKHDYFEAGHSSTSLSALAGLLFTNGKNSNIAIIGDASISGGEAMEALNYLGALNKKSIIILNDNKMAISKNVGALSNFLTGLRGNSYTIGASNVIKKIFPKFIYNFFEQIIRSIKGFLQPKNIFEDLGFQYFGPINGNDMKSLIRVLKKAKKLKTKCVIHVITEKGKGYKYAEEDKVGDYHGVGSFDIETGYPTKPKEGYVSYSEIISEGNIKLEEKYNQYIVTPAMINGCKLAKFGEMYPDKLLDVGIAEAHAATMVASMALSGNKVFLPMYSTFSQRAYDQILHDIARHDVNVVIGIDRAGIVGEDGSTHQGLYDVAFFNHIPNITITMPSTPEEAWGLLDYGFSINHPFVIRYPKMSVKCNLNDVKAITINNPSWEIINEGNKGILITYGPRIISIKDKIIKNNMDITVVNARFIRPLDYNMLDKIFNMNKPILIYEEVVESGSMALDILKYANGKNVKIDMMSFKDEFIPHGAINDILKRYNMDDDSVIERLKKLCD